MTVRPQAAMMAEKVSSGAGGSQWCCTNLLRTKFLFKTVGRMLLHRDISCIYILIGPLNGQFFALGSRHAAFQSKKLLPFNCKVEALCLNNAGFYSTKQEIQSCQPFDNILSYYTRYEDQTNENKRKER